MSNQSPIGGIELKDALNALRSEIVLAEQGRGEGPTFKVEELEVCFEVASARDMSGDVEIGGKVKFMVVDADLKGKLALGQKHLSTHKVTFKLKVLNSEGESIDLSQ